MKELTNSCCLQHVSGGAFGWTGDDCPGCRGDWDKQDKNSQSQVSRDMVVKVGGWAGSAIGTFITYGTGAGPVVSGLVGIGVSEFGGFVAGTIYDDPKTAEHPDYYVPTGNLVNPYNK